MFDLMSSVLFSNLTSHNLIPVSIISPNGKYWACAGQSQLWIWNVDSKESVNKFTCEHTIDGFGWSPDSRLIFCNVGKKCIIQIWNLDNPLWKCIIDESPLAIVDVFWSPDSCHLLVTSEFHLKITVWSLVSNTTSIIEYPKAIRKYLSFSHCDRFLAVAERRKHEDFISIYTCDTFENIKTFSVETKDLQEISFSPSEPILAVLEASIEGPKVLFYFINGQLFGKYSRSTNFGFTGLSWSYDGNCVALGDICGKVTLLHHDTFSEAVSYQVPESIVSDDTVIYNVCPKPEKSSKCSGADFSNYEIYEVVKNRPFCLSSLMAAPEKTKSKSVKKGIKSLEFSSCRRYLVFINDSYPKVAFIFDVKLYRLTSVIIHQYRITDVCWHPAKPTLALCSNSENLYLWTPSFCTSVPSPFTDDFRIHKAAWCPEKDVLLLNSKTHSSLLYLPQFPLGSST